MRKFKIFGRERSYDFAFEVKSDIRGLKKLKEEIKKPFILCYTGFDLIQFDGVDDIISERMLMWLYEAKSTGDIRSCIEECSIEDTIWTTDRNKNYTYTAYKKMSFKDQTLELLEKEVNKHIKKLENNLQAWETEKAKEKKDKEEREKEWEVIEVIQEIKPSGGETGPDGYYEAIYREKSTGREVRMVSRDVFDFGLFSYPKRVEKSKDDIFSDANWSKEEKNLRAWIAEFGAFRDKKVRM